MGETIEEMNRKEKADDQKLIRAQKDKVRKEQEAQRRLALKSYKHSDQERTKENFPAN